MGNDRPRHHPHNRARPGVGLGAYHLLQGRGEDQRGQAGEPFVQAKGKEPEKPDKERIVGIWRMEKAYENWPVELKVLLRVHLTKDGELRHVVPDDVTKVLGEAPPIKGTYELIEAGKIDINMTQGGKNFVVPAIYKFEGNDRLNICIGFDNTHRPNSNSTKARK